MASAQATVRIALKAAAARLPDLFAPGTRLVVGFSGGQDSTCLLHALKQHRSALELLAVHVDHALRPDSASGARRVVESGACMQVEVVIQRVDVAAYRREMPGRSVQEAARAARYQALACAAQRFQAAAVVVAHTADDQAETVLLNLLRGTGLAGLGGMRMDEMLQPLRLGPRLPELGPIPRTLRLARPLLRATRSVSLAYCSELGLSVVEDGSNGSLAYTRNRVRLELLPALERFNPAIRTVLARTADLAAEDLGALESIVAPLHASLAHDFEYDLRLWRAQPRALQRRLLRYGLESLLGTLIDVPASPIDDALDLVQSGHAAQTYHLPYGVELSMRPATFVLSLHGRARARARPNTRVAEASRV